MERSEKTARPATGKEYHDYVLCYEFGRNLSPIENADNRKLDRHDHYPLELIESALKEAVLNRVYSLKYIDRILLAWEKKNIRSVKIFTQQQLPRT